MKVKFTGEAPMDEVLWSFPTCESLPDCVSHVITR